MRLPSRVAFVGLGAMGLPMARNLLAAGVPLVVANRSRAAVEVAVALGAVAASTPRDAAAGADVVITMLPDTPDVMAVGEGQDGVLAGISAESVWVEMSTISPLAARRLAEAAAARAAAFLDAPVSGGQPAAEAGSLTIMVGGAEAVLARVRPVLDVLGSTVTRVGDHGAGQITKAANQIVVGGTIALVAEAFAFAARLGVDAEVVREALLGGFAQSRVLEVHGRRMIDETFAPGFRTDLQHKDLSIALDVGRAERIPLPMTSQVRELFNVLRAQGCGDLDHSALSLVYERLSRTEQAVS